MTPTQLDVCRTRCAGKTEINSTFVATLKAFVPDAQALLDANRMCIALVLDAVRGPTLISYQDNCMLS